MILIEITAFRDDNRFIEGNPPLHPVSEQCKALSRIRCKCLYRFPVFEAALLHPVHGQIKVVKTQDRLDPPAKQFIDHCIIKRGAFRIYRSFTILDEPAPLNGGAVGIHTDLLHKSGILFIFVIEIRGHGRPDSLVKQLRGLFKPVIPFHLRFLVPRKASL